MSDLGALLKKAREQRDLSLDDIQDLTKIRKRYLEAIEEGNYSVLPGSFYVRAFVKNYAEAVGLDAEEVLRLYNKEIPSSVPEQQVIEPVQRPRRATQSQTSDRISRWGFRALMWSFLLLIIVLVYIFAIKQPTKDKVDSADQTKMTDETKPPETSPDKDTVKNGDQGQNTSTTGGTTGAERPAGAIRGRIRRIRRPIRLRIRRRLLRPRRLRWTARPDRPTTTMFHRAARIRLN